MPHSSPSLAPEPEPFRVEVHPERDGVRVVPVGEVDIATVGEIDARLRELNQAGFRHVVLDLRQLTFIDSTGLRLVLTWHAAARQNDIDVMVLEGPPAVQRVFALAGVLHRLPFRT
jgi:anti-sigma B factor antagonist